MKSILFLASLICFTTFIACNKQNINDLDPNVLAAKKLYVGFTIDNPNGNVNETEALLLTNNSENAVAYFWDFGNGTTSSLKQPEFSYPRCGNYTITLTVTAADGSTQSIKKDIVALCIFGGKHDSI